MSSKALGSFFVALASLLWATDALFRVPAITSVDATWIVFFEHLMGTALLGPWMWWKAGKQARPSGFKEWFCLIVVGAGGSAIATIFFTASFKFINPSLAILLQKLQPLLVVCAARIFLKEKWASGFLRWALLALASAIVLSFPDFDFSFLSHGLDLRSRGLLYATSAMVIWGFSTVAGKALLKTKTPLHATFWRYVVGLITVSALLALSGSAGSETSWPSQILHSQNLALSLLYICLFPGILALFVYYLGLARTPANVATFLELLYPVGAVLLNTVFLHLPLMPIQLGAAFVLLFAVTKVSLKTP